MDTDSNQPLQSEAVNTCGVPINFGWKLITYSGNQYISNMYTKRYH